MLEDVLNGMTADKNATIIEVSTKLVLDWADLHRPVSQDDLSNSIKTIIQAYNGALSTTGDLEKQAVAALVKSASRLTSYWYNQNKSADIEQLTAIISQFVTSISEELK